MRVYQNLRRKIEGWVVYVEWAVLIRKVFFWKEISVQEEWNEQMRRIVVGYIMQFLCSADISFLFILNMLMLCFPGRY